jgi:polyisoprenoid-binding protein YceI
MRLSRLLFLLGALAYPLCAAQYSLELKPGATKIEWTLGDVLHTVHGTFQMKRGSIVFDPETGAASGEIVVDVASGQSGNGARDRRMQENVLESAKFPEAVFVPARIEGKLIPDGSSDVKIYGTFRIHGAAHEITMNVKSHIADDHIDAQLTFDIPYVAWGMKDPSTFVLKVSKTVQLSVQTSGGLEKR